MPRSPGDRPASQWLRGAPDPLPKLWAEWAPARGWGRRRLPGGPLGWCCKGPPETGGRKDGVLQSLPPQAGSRLSSQALELPGWLGPRTGPAQRPGATHAVSAAGGEQLWSLPAVPHAGLGVPAQPPPEPAARGHEVHRWVLPAQGPLSARALGSAPGGRHGPASRAPVCPRARPAPRPAATCHLRPTQGPCCRTTSPTSASA